MLRLAITDDPEVSAWFWELLKSCGRSLRVLCRTLEQLPKEQLAEAFDRAGRFDYTRDDAGLTLFAYRRRE